MSRIGKLLVVFALGVAELWAAAPAGVVMRLHPLLVCLVAAAGAALGGATVVLLGEKVRIWIRKKRRGREIEKQSGFLYGIWQRYGVIGWGLLAPLLVGTPLGAAFGLALGAPARRLMLWLSVGSVLWSVVFTTISALGLRIFKPA